MHALTESVWEVISWKSKSEYDSASDQYTRIFMPKMFIVSSLIMAFSYFNDKLNCIAVNRLSGNKEFVQDTCWIQGFYIYHEMHTKLNESSYYGIPEEFGYDGVSATGRLCSTEKRAGGKNIECRAMTRRYFLHYQWLPFFVCSLAILYFIPYLVFKFGNSDMISLVDTVKTGTLRDVEKIAHNYFNYKINSKMKMQIIVLFNMVVKGVFIGANVCGFVITDYSLDGRFFHYGIQWLHFSDYPNHIAHDILRKSVPKPGDYLLPSVGMCDIHEALNDKRAIYIDKHKIICEISQNIKYQYVFIMLWCFFVIGIGISSLGFLYYCYTIFKTLLIVYESRFFRKHTLTSRIHAQLTVREMEYLEKIKSIDISMYGELLRELTRYKPDIHDIKRFSEKAKDETITLLPVNQVGENVFLSFHP